MVGNSQRAAWNKAMGLPSNPNSTITLGKKRLRREKKGSTRRVHSSDGGGATGVGSNSPFDVDEYPHIIRLDRLEKGGQVNFAAEEDDEEEVGGFYTTKNKKDDDEDEYDDLEELDDTVSGKKKKRGHKKTSGKRDKKAISKDKIILPKWIKVRNVSSILIEESTRTDGILKQYLQAEARPTETSLVYPTRKFCPVTGLLGCYKDPKTGLAYATTSALEQIQERIPPWMSSGSGGGSTLYYETMNSLRNTTTITTNSIESSG